MPETYQKPIWRLPEVSGQSVIDGPHGTCFFNSNGQQSPFFNFKFYTLSRTKLGICIRYTFNQRIVLLVFVGFFRSLSWTESIFRRLEASCAKALIRRKPARYSANVYRDLQGLYEEIGVQGFQIYGDCMFTRNPCNF